MPEERSGEQAMTKTISFTKAALEALPLPLKGKRTYVRDAKTRGLILDVTSAGAKTFYVYRKVDGKPERIRIGPFPDLTIEQARRRAEEINGDIARGENPAKKKRAAQAGKTLEELFTWYLEQPKKSGPRSEKTDLEYRKQFRLHLASLARRSPEQITSHDVEALIHRIGRDHGPYMANRVLALLRAIFNKAKRKSLIKGDNPAAGIEAFAERSRERRLMPHELERFFTAVEAEQNETMRDYVLISLYTGARKSNVLAMRWDEIDFEARIWRIPVTKNGTPQSIPLEDAEIGILDRRRSEAAPGCPWVFPSSGSKGHLADPKAGWNRILTRAGIQDLRLHDLRRSLASVMLDSGVPLAVVGKTLNHLSPTTTAIYARLSLDPIREAKRAAHDALRGRNSRKEEVEHVT